MARPRMKKVPARPSPVRNARELEALPERSKRARANALNVIAVARREDLSIAEAIQAVRASGEPVSRPSVLRYAGEAIRRGPGGVLVPTQGDRLYRRVPVLTTDGVEYVDVRSSRQASLAGKYRYALRAYLGEDDPTGTRLRRFRGKSVGGRTLETDLDRIDDWANRRVLDPLDEEGS